tara:strand:+ start:965 stop:1648 length:684 start_codon:yes stop_codon:yes gene_type:complete
MKVDTIILAGGLGTRIRSILDDTPKCLAPINGRPFIDLLIDDLIKKGFKRFIVCVGYLKEKIIHHLERRNDCIIVFSEENQLLGTAGAIKNAEKFILSKRFIVLNGDTFVDINFTHWHNNLKELESISLIKSKNSGQYGSVVIDKKGFLKSFLEKTTTNISENYINTGRYFFSKETLSEIPTGQKYSLEYDLFPKLIKKRNISSYIIKNQIIDIGTPESYKTAQKLL